MQVKVIDSKDNQLQSNTSITLIDAQQERVEVMDRGAIACSFRNYCYNSSYRTSHSNHSY